MTHARLQMKPTAIKRLLQLSVWCALGFSLVGPSQLEAAFVRDYGLSNFDFSNYRADGTATTPDNGLSVVLTGGDTGSGLYGTTTLKITATGNGWVKFNYAYSSIDLPSMDFAGYLLGVQFSWLADTDGDSGFISFPVVAGQEFGFVVATEDNTWGRGVLTISNFDAPSAVPEPGMAPIAAAALGAMLFFGPRLRKLRSCGEKAE